MRYTSLQNQGTTNVQSNFSGGRENAIQDFKEECRCRQVTWGYLFEEKTGEVVASYNVGAGLLEA